jgi:hypothetical protein
MEPAITGATEAIRPVRGTAAMQSGRREEWLPTFPVPAAGRLAHRGQLGSYRRDPATERCRGVAILPSGPVNFEADAIAGVADAFRAAIDAALDGPSAGPVAVDAPDGGARAISARPASAPASIAPEAA